MCGFVSNIQGNSELTQTQADEWYKVYKQREICIESSSLTAHKKIKYEEDHAEKSLYQCKEQ